MLNCHSNKSVINWIKKRKNIIAACFKSIQKGVLMVVVTSRSSLGSGRWIMGVLYVIFGWYPFSSATQLTVIMVPSGKVNEYLPFETVPNCSSDESSCLNLFWTPLSSTLMPFEVSKLYVTFYKYKSSVYNNGNKRKTSSIDKYL